MLTIHNIEKLENQKVAYDWVVSSAYKRAASYSITLRTEIFPYQRIVELSRFVEFGDNGVGYYFFFNSDGEKTTISLRLEQVKDINTILTVLNWFTV